MNNFFKDKYHTLIPACTCVNRPTWTVIIPTRNNGAYLRKTIESVLIQDPGEEKMEIIVVDDDSTKDNPENIINSTGKQNRIKFIKQTKNVGKALNYVTGLKAATGKLIHILHGDDMVKFDFYTRMEKIINDHPSIGAAYCQANYINEYDEAIGKTGEIINKTGIISDFIEKIVVAQQIQPPSIVIKRDVYEELGAYDERLRFFEDWEMYVRISNYYPVAFTPEILAQYRVHSQSSSQKSIKNGERIKVQRLAIKIMNNYIDENIVKKIRKKRNTEQAYYLIQFIPNVLKNKDIKTYFLIVFNVLKFSMLPITIYRLSSFSFRNLKEN